MFDYSNLIVEAMEYVDKKIENLNPNSVNKSRLHSKVNIEIVANIKKSLCWNALMHIKRLIIFITLNYLKSFHDIYKFQFIEQNKITPMDFSKSVGVNYLFSAEQLCLFGPSRTPVPTRRMVTSL